jgi:hypothetical protein
MVAGSRFPVVRCGTFRLKIAGKDDYRETSLARSSTMVRPRYVLLPTLLAVLLCTASLHISADGAAADAPAKTPAVDQLYPYNYPNYNYGYNSYGYNSYPYNSYGYNNYPYSSYYGGYNSYPYSSYYGGYNSYPYSSYNSYPYNSYYGGYNNYPSNSYYGGYNPYYGTSSSSSATTSTTTASPSAAVTPAPTYVSSGSYCTLPGGGQVWVPSGASPSSMGCTS